MTTVAIIGAGRVGSAVATATAGRGHCVIGVADSDPGAAQRLARALEVAVLEPTDLVRAADLTLLTVPDDLVGQVAEQLAAGVRRGSAGPLHRAESGRSRGSAGPSHPTKAPRSAALVHCSGALDLTPLESMASVGWAVGAWHPLQAFPSPRTPVAEGITWAITADPPLRDVLADLTTDLGGNPRFVAAEARRQYHAAAVMASNYLVTLAAHAADVLTECGFTREEALAALVPLMITTIDGLAQAGLPEALTGPLARADTGTIAGHLTAIADRPATATLYRALAQGTEPLLIERGLPALLIERIRLLVNTSGS